MKKLDRVKNFKLKKKIRDLRNDFEKLDFHGLLAKKLLLA